MSAIETGLYVAVGAFDLAAEKVRDIPGMKDLADRTSKIRETSLIEQARDLEPKVRKQAKELQARGEDVVARIRKEAQEFPSEARKQLQELPERLQELPRQISDQLSDLPEVARKQAEEIRDAFQNLGQNFGDKRFGRTEQAKPALKTSAKAATGTAKSAAGTAKAAAPKATIKASPKTTVTKSS